MATAQDQRTWPRKEVLSPIPSELLPDTDNPDLLEINIGPNHPSTHGVLRLVTTLDGELVVGLRPVIGYVHTGIEKNIEQKTYWKAITYVPRMDYLSFFNGETAFCMAVEKALDLEVPRRGEWIRVLFQELNRIHSHLIFLGTGSVDLGGIALLFYCFRDRDYVLDLFEMVTGQRMHPRYCQVGGVAEDLPRGFERECRTFIKRLRRSIDEYDGLIAANPIWRERTEGVGVCPPDFAIRMGLSGPNLRASGVPYDLRRSEPYSIYPDLEFDVAVREHGDIFDRYLVRIDEMRESIRILKQVLRLLDDTKGQPFFAGRGGYNVRVPAGESYGRVENPKGELGYYVVSDGGQNPWRYHVRAPSFINLTALEKMCIGNKVADVVAILGSIDIVLGELDR